MTFNGKRATKVGEVGRGHAEMATYAWVKLDDSMGLWARVIHTDGLRWIVRVDDAPMEIDSDRVHYLTWDE